MCYGAKTWLVSILFSFAHDLSMTLIVFMFSLHDLGYSDVQHPPSIMDFCMLKTAGQVV